MFKILKYIKPYWKYVLAAPLLMLIEVACDLLQPNLVARIIDEGVAQGNLSLVIRLGLQMIGIALIGVVGGVGCTVTSSVASMNFGADLRTIVYKKVQQFSFANLDKFNTGSLITRLTNDIVQVQQLVIMGLRMLVRAPLLCIGGFIMAISINARLSMILIVATPILLASVTFIIKKGFPLFNIVQKRLDRLNDVTRENLTGVRVIKAFVRSETEKKRFAEANNSLIEISVKASRLMMLMFPIMMTIMNLSVVAVLWYGGIQVSQGTMRIGEILAFINYLTQILFSLMMVTFMLVNFSRAKVSGDRIQEVLQAEVDIKDSEEASDAQIKNGRVTFENVSFRYQGAGGEPVLDNISFTAEPGEVVAILGATGSGKSTLVNLIPRLYDVTEGRILVDGRDVRSMKLKTLREGISVVLQESILFSGSIKENISWGKEEASDEEIVEAAKAAQAHDFITNFPEGYETKMGQRGVNVSGGQKQRLSIARAIIKKPPILILDDSTSAVDMATEAKIQKALKELMGHATCFVIAQRISTVLDADKIIVLEDGKIVSMGNHDELLKTSAVYQDIYKSQLGEGAVVNG
jgi:ATP-binding cassette, subfamily B, multidrug efflux pump